MRGRGKLILKTGKKKVKLKPYIEKLSKSNEFKKFTAKNPQAYLAAGFFVIDLVEGKNIHQLDYYHPDNKKMTTFTLDKGVEAKESDSANEIVPKKINAEVNLDLDIIKGLVEDEMKNNIITTKLQKIIAVLQNLDNKLIWNLNCITTDMGIIKVHIDDDSHSILKFEKINLFDIVRKI